MAKEKFNFDSDDFQEKLFKALKGSDLGSELEDAEIGMKIIRIDDEGDVSLIDLLSQSQRVIREMSILNEMQSEYIERNSD